MRLFFFLSVSFCCIWTEFIFIISFFAFFTIPQLRLSAAQLCGIYIYIFFMTENNYKMENLFEFMREKKMTEWNTRTRAQKKRIDCPSDVSEREQAPNEIIKIYENRRKKIGNNNLLQNECD